MPGAVAAFLGDGRLHLQHGPIDLVIKAWGEPDEVDAAYRQVKAGFAGILETLAAELPVLRAPLGTTRSAVRGPVAARMVEAVWPYRAMFVTPMAAVAGAVADEMLARMAAGRRLARAYVNDGGDIALHLAPGEALTFGMVADIEQPRLEGKVRIDSQQPARGVATSGRGGRSLSLGMADAVTVLAASAAAADAAATLIANAVHVEHPAVRRAPASSLDPDSDLGDRLVTVTVPQLDAAMRAAALDAGAAFAASLRARGLVHAASLWLQGEVRLVGELPALLQSQPARRKR